MYDPLLIEDVRRRTTGGNAHRVANLVCNYTLACEVEDRLSAALSLFPESSGLRRQLADVQRKELRYAQEMRRIL